MQIPLQTFDQIGTKQAQMQPGTVVNPPSGPAPIGEQGSGYKTFLEASEGLMSKLGGAIIKLDQNKLTLLQKETYYKQDLDAKQNERKLQKLIPTLATKNLDVEYVLKLLKDPKGDFRFGEQIEYTENNDHNNLMNARLQLKQEEVLGRAMEMLVGEQKIRMKIDADNTTDRFIGDMSELHVLKKPYDLENTVAKFKHEMNPYIKAGILKESELVRASRILKRKWLTVKAQLDHDMNPTGFAGMDIEDVMKKYRIQFKRKLYPQTHFTPQQLQTPPETEVQADPGILLKLWQSSNKTADEENRQLVNAGLNYYHAAERRAQILSPQGDLYENFKLLPEAEQKAVRLGISQAEERIKDGMDMVDFKVEIMSGGPETNFKNFTIVGSNGQASPNYKYIADVVRANPKWGDAESKQIEAIVKEAIANEANSDNITKSSNSAKIEGLIRQNKWKKASEMLEKHKNNELLLHPTDAINLESFYNTQIKTEQEEKAERWLKTFRSQEPEKVSVQSGYAEAKDQNTKFIEAYEKNFNPDGEPVPLGDGERLEGLPPLEQQMRLANPKAVHQQFLLATGDVYASSKSGEMAEVEMGIANITTLEDAKQFEAGLSSNTFIGDTQKKLYKARVITLKNQLKENEIREDKRKADKLDQEESAKFDGIIRNAKSIDALPSKKDIQSKEGLTKLSRIVLEANRELKETQLTLEKEKGIKLEVIEKSLLAAERADTAVTAQGIINKLTREILPLDSDFNKLSPDEKLRLTRALETISTNKTNQFQRNNEIEYAKEKGVAQEKISRAIKEAVTPEEVDKIRQAITSGQPVSVFVAEGEEPDIVATNMTGTTEQGGLLEGQRQLLLTQTSTRGSALSSANIAENLKKEDGMFFARIDRASSEAVIESEFTKLQQDIDNYRKKPGMDEEKWLYDLESRVRSRKKAIITERRKHDFMSKLYDDPWKVKNIQTSEYGPKGKYYGLGLDIRQVHKLADTIIDERTPDPVDSKALQDSLFQYSKYLVNKTYFPQSSEAGLDPLMSIDHEGHSIKERLTAKQRKKFVELDIFMIHMKTSIENALTSERIKYNKLELALALDDVNKTNTSVHTQQMFKIMDDLINSRINTINDKDLGVGYLMMQDLYITEKTGQKVNTEEDTTNLQSNTNDNWYRREDVKIIDGDTIKILKNGTWHKVRMRAVNTAELKDPTGAGVKAQKALEDLLSDVDEINVRFGPKGYWGRDTGYIFTKKNVFINKKMIELGHSPKISDFGYSYHHLEAVQSQRSLSR